MLVLLRITTGAQRRQIVVIDEVLLPCLIHDYQVNRSEILWWVLLIFRKWRFDVVPRFLLLGLCAYQCVFGIKCLLWTVSAWLDIRRSALARHRPRHSDLFFRPGPRIKLRGIFVSLLRASPIINTGFIGWVTLKPRIIIHSTQRVLLLYYIASLRFPVTRIDFITLLYLRWLGLIDAGGGQWRLFTRVPRFLFLPGHGVS